MARTKEGLDTFDHNPRTVRFLALDDALRPPRRLPVARLAACSGAVALAALGYLTRIGVVHLLPVEEVGGYAKAERAARWQAVDLRRRTVHRRRAKGNNRTAQAMRIR